MTPDERINHIENLAAAFYLVKKGYYRSGAELLEALKATPNNTLAEYRQLSGMEGCPEKTLFRRLLNFAYDCQKYGTNLARDAHNQSIEDLKGKVRAFYAEDSSPSFRLDKVTLQVESFRLRSARTFPSIADMKEHLQGFTNAWGRYSELYRDEKKAFYHLYQALTYEAIGEKEKARGYRDTLEALKAKHSTSTPPKEEETTMTQPNFKLETTSFTRVFGVELTGLSEEELLSLIRAAKAELDSLQDMKESKRIAHRCASIEDGIKTLVAKLDEGVE